MVGKFIQLILSGISLRCVHFFRHPRAMSTDFIVFVMIRTYKTCNIIIECASPPGILVKKNQNKSFLLEEPICCPTSNRSVVRQRDSSGQKCSRGVADKWMRIYGCWRRWWWRWRWWRMRPSSSIRYLLPFMQLKTTGRLNVLRPLPTSQNQNINKPSLTPYRLAFESRSKSDAQIRHSF